MQINQKENFGRGKQLCISSAPVQRSFSCTRKLKNPARWSLQHVRNVETGKARGRSSGSICCPHACNGKLEQTMQSNWGKKITSLPELANFPITQHTYSAIPWQHNLTFKKFFTNLQKVFFTWKGSWYFAFVRIHYSMQCLCLIFYISVVFTTIADTDFYCFHIVELILTRFILVLFHTKAFNEISSWGILYYTQKYPRALYKLIFHPWM